MILAYLTLFLVAVVVLVLVAYLVAIAYFLRRADRNLVQLLDGLQAIRGHVRPLPEDLGTINAALRQVRLNLLGSDSHLAAAARVFGEE